MAPSTTPQTSILSSSVPFVPVPHIRALALNRWSPYYLSVRVVAQSVAATSCVCTNHTKNHPSGTLLCHRCFNVPVSVTIKHLHGYFAVSFSACNHVSMFFTSVVSKNTLAYSSDTPASLSNFSTLTTSGQCSPSPYYFPFNPHWTALPLVQYGTSLPLLCDKSPQRRLYLLQTLWYPFLFCTSDHLSIVFPLLLFPFTMQTSSSPSSFSLRVLGHHIKQRLLCITLRIF